MRPVHIVSTPRNYRDPLHDGEHEPGDILPVRQPYRHSPQ